MNENDALQTVEVGRYSTITDAEVARGILESSGIECYILNQSMGSAFPDLSTAQNIKLFVNTKNEELAKKILSADFVPEK